MFKLGATLFSLYDSSPQVAKNVVASAYAFWSGLKKYGPTYEQWRHTLGESQWWDSSALRTFQGDQIIRLIRFVAKESPYYADQMRRHAIDPQQVGTPEELRRFPIMDKHVARQHHGEIRTSLARDPHLEFATSGTTGASLHVPTTREALQREYAFRWQFQSIAGAQRGDRFAFFTGHSVIPVKRTRPPFHIRNFAENSIMFSLYHMADATMPSYVAELTDFAPAYVLGYPSGISVLARYVVEQGITVPAPRAIFTGSEKLHTAQRKLIEKAFHCPVYQWFGQVEMTVNLHECQYQRLHVKEEYGLLELLRDDGTEVAPGEMGNVVATGWGNWAFPLIRYRTGDIMHLAKDQSCPCGRGGRIIEEIIGRDDDIILTPEGRYIGRLDFVFKPIDTIVEAQITQEAVNRLLIRVVPLSGFGKGDEELLVHKLQTYVGSTMEIRVECVDQIPRTPTGKVRTVVSDLVRPFAKSAIALFLLLGSSGVLFLGT